MGTGQRAVIRKDSSDSSAGGERAPLLPELDGLAGLHAAVLVDRAGRLVETMGIPERDRIRQVASLVAGMHATGARLSEASGDPGRARITIRAGSSVLLLIPLPRPSTLLLLLVLDGEIAAGVRGALDRLVDRIRAELPDAATVLDPREFEATLERSLGRSEPEPGGFDR